MQIELKKVNLPDGTHWYGIWVNGSCETSYNTDLEAAKADYEKIKEVNKNPVPKYEIIFAETI